MEHSGIVFDLILLLGLSVLIVLAFRRLRLPAIAGYLVAGVAAGPHALGWVDRTEEVEILAELGVVLLLFSIGLEFSLPRLLAQGRRLLLSGGGQVLLTVALATLLAWSVDLSARTALLVGFLVAMSSTGFVLKTLSDTRQVEAPHGRLTVGILLFQDLIVVVMMLLVPLLAEDADTGPVTLLKVLCKALAAIAGVVLFARYGFPRAASLVMRLGGRELFVLFVALVAMGTAFFSSMLGLSVALGAFIAGLFISESEYSHQVVADVLPFRDVFNALFFISIGMLMDPAVVAEQPLLVLSLVLVVAALKGLIVVLVGFLVTRSLRTALLSAIALAQIGEFSFLLAQQGREAGLLDPGQVQLFLAVAVLTMFIAPFAIRLAPALFERLGLKESSAGDGGDEPSDQPAVIVVGYGLNGKNLSRVLSATGLAFRVLELNADSVMQGRKEGLPIHFGDASRVETLLAAGVRHAKILVFAISDPASTRRGVALARRLAPSIHIIVRTRFVTEHSELIRLGADEVIPEEFETSIEIFSRVLRRLHVPRGNIAVQAALIRREGYGLLRTGVDPVEGMEEFRGLLDQMAVDTLLLPADAPVLGLTLREVDLRSHCGVSVIAVVRDGEAIHDVGPGLRLTANDVLLILGSHEGVEQCRDLLSGHGLGEPADDPVESPA